MTQSFLNNFLQCLKILCDKPIVSQLIDICQDRSHVFFVLRYEENGSLLDYMNYHSVLEMDLARKITIDIVSGLQHLHKNNIIHGDMKPENVLLDGNLRAHVGDFGMVLPSNVSDVWYGTYGTSGYQAPEQLAGNIIWDHHRVDYFAVGVMLLQMTSGQHPSGTTIPQIDTNVVKLRFIMPPISAEAESFVRQTR